MDHQQYEAHLRSRIDEAKGMHPRIYEARKKVQRDEYDAMLGARLEGEDRVLNLVMQGYTYEQIKEILKR